MKNNTLTLSELIGKTLSELEKSKGYPGKDKYLIDEVIMEVSVSSISSERTGLDLKIFNYGEKEGGKNIHKVIVKLKPRGLKPRK